MKGEKVVIRAKKEKNQIIQRLAGGLLKHKFLYAVIILAVMASVSVGRYCIRANTANAFITLNYEEATKGLYPNSTRFNISLVKAREVLGRAIEKGGIKNVTPEEMAGNITAKASNSGRPYFSAGDYSIATSYEIIYRKNPEIGNLSAQQILEMILQSYKEIFYENYTYSKANLEIEWGDCDSLEYVEVGEFFKKESSKIQRYLYSKVKENGTYHSKTTDETFASLKKSIDNFIKVDLEKYNSYVKRSGLSKNKERFVNKLSYQNFLLDIIYQKYMGEYQIRMDSIDLYNSALTAVVLVPTVDVQDEFYMSRTKVAIDYQAEAAERVNANANDTKETINANKYIMKQVKSVKEPSELHIDKAEKMIQNMQEKLLDIAEKTEATNREYTKYKTKNHLNVTYLHEGWKELLSVTWSLAAGIAAGGMLCVWVLMTTKRRGNV